MQRSCRRKGDVVKGEGDERVSTKAEVSRFLNSRFQADISWPEASRLHLGAIFTDVEDHAIFLSSLYFQSHHAA
jgi:hypothetical protein